MPNVEITKAIKNVRKTTPLVHCITNYVTVNDCANALLACGGSPIMSDEPLDVEDIATICGGLVLNIGTLNAQSIEGMRIAGATATKLSHPIVLDPVGAGASSLRTQTASELMDANKISVIRGNMSEVKALAGASAQTRGVDVNPEDAVTETNLQASADFAKSVATKTSAVVAITGAIDIVADAKDAFAIRNGSPIMGKITGTGCMLSAISGAYATANPEDTIHAMVAAVAGMGIAGEIAASRMTSQDGNGSFRTYLLDALYNMNVETLMKMAKVEAL